MPNTVFMLQKNPELERNLSMLVGINYPWIHYGWDFGDPPSSWITEGGLSVWREEKRRQIEEDFRGFASQGIFAIRWFLLADGINYGMDELAAKSDGEYWTFDPLPAGHPYYGQLRNDFEFVLQICANHGLKLFPSLIDYRWCCQGTVMEGSPGLIKGGRYDIIRDPVKRDAFFERVLDPLLATSLRYRDSIYAWELINEPEWVIRQFTPFGEREGNRTLSLREMNQFIGEGISRINLSLGPDGRSAFKSSIGFAHWDSLDKWDSEKIDVTLHQFHYYAQGDCNLPSHPNSDDYQCVVGEFATTVGRDWPDLKRMHRDQTVSNRLYCIEAKGYQACFIWSARAADAATRWTENERQQIIEFTGSHRSDSLA